MQFLPNILTELQAAIAVVAARERAITALLVAVWGRIGRMRRRLERLIALWRAGILPPVRVRPSRAGETRATARKQTDISLAPGWLLAQVRRAGSFRCQLEQILTEAECVEFLAAVPQARRIMRGLARMVGLGVRVRRVVPIWDRPADPPVRAGLVLGPGGRAIYV